jgi:hypothetical protein
MGMFSGRAAQTAKAAKTGNGRGRTSATVKAAETQQEGIGVRYTNQKHVCESHCDDPCPLAHPAA